MGNNIYQNPDIDFVSLFKDLYSRWKEDFFFTEPETITQLLAREGITVHPKVQEKIEALKALIRNNLCYEKWHLFEKMVLVINGLTPNFFVMQVPKMREIYKAVKTMLAIKDEKFSDEVAKYIACVAREQGYVYLPEELSFAQPYLDLLYSSLEEQQLKKMVKEGWELIKNEDPTKLKFDENNPVDVQLSKLLEMVLYAQLPN